MEMEMEVERYDLHDHPLTLCKNEKADTDNRSCPLCGWPFVGYGDHRACCSCKFHIQECSACGNSEVTMGSFYYCKRCLPKSPLFHVACPESRPQMKIALRPDCSLVFVKESSATFGKSSLVSSKPFHCDFCSKSKPGDRYRCDLCNFQICAAGCSGSLVKYHQGRQHINHISHQHPLVRVPLEQEMQCKICYNRIDEESYCCTPCGFYIHKSCGELPQHVQRHHFHPQHPLELRKMPFFEFRTMPATVLYDETYCDACCFEIGASMCYLCDDCNIHFHPECLFMNPSVKHQCHQQHLLTLVENMSFRSSCCACNDYIEGTFFARCVKCCLDFHLQCGPAPASLPPTVVDEVKHSHPLSLTAETTVVEDPPPCCDICNKDINPNHPRYGCAEPECEYYAHVRCIITGVQLGKTDETFKHLLHRHRFVLEIQRDDEMECDVCKELITKGHPLYVSKRYEMFIHQSCFELPPVIYHEFHSHYLVLSTDHQSEECNTCGKEIDNLAYGCEWCLFRLDLDCASKHPSVKWKSCNTVNDEEEVEDGGEGIRHFSHYHPLTLLDHDDEVGDTECKLCYESIHGLSYGCAPCMFYTHKSCAELPLEVQHLSLKRNPLTLQQNTSYNRAACGACLLDINTVGISYKSDDACDYGLHTRCANLKPNIKYPGHQHPVILVENMEYEGNCETCHFGIKGTFFLRCVECDLHFHVRCGPAFLPSTVVHQHHGHPLALSNASDGISSRTGLLHCDACMDEIRTDHHPSYSCVVCGYYAHVRCVVTESMFDEIVQLDYFIHKHILLVVGVQSDDNFVCFACDKQIQAQEPACGCNYCKCYLHRSCAGMPRQIQHFFHKHPLTLHHSHSDDQEKIHHHCSACTEKLQSFYYECHSCCFALDLDCASTLQRQVQFEEGEEHHILTLFERLQHGPSCRGYISATYGAFDQNCVKCNFRVYLLRSPLPQSIDCPSHHHSLALQDSVYDDSYRMHVCDVCEEERDAELSAYYCAECDFVAEFDCVIYEVILALQKKPGNVSLRRIRRNTAMTVNRKRMTFKDFLQSFTDEESNELDSLVKVFNEENEEICKKFPEAVEAGESSDAGVFVYSDEYFLQHLAALCSDQHIVSLLKDQDFYMEVLDVGDYKTIPRFVGILKNLLDKYGDIGATCHYSNSTKMFVMIMFCATVESMRNTMIQDVDYGLLYTWWRYFTLAHRSGFRFDLFVFEDHLKRIAEARHRIQSDFHQTMISPIEEYYEEMAKRCKEIDEQAHDTGEQRQNLHLLRQQTHDRISSISFQYWRSETRRLSQAREIGMTKAALYTGVL